MILAREEEDSFIQVISCFQGWNYGFLKELTRETRLDSEPKFFYLYKILEAQRVEIVATYLEGRADTWFQGFLVNK